ncbi:MAG: hypothetical protein GY898_10860 [Proteobacteria bacterium]|nr:hypothetical protein [Pseudomonadota bacterium]
MRSLPYLCLLAAASFVVRPPAAAAQDDAETAIRALIETPGKHAWDLKVAYILRANYDSNGSGKINRKPEVDAIPCATWAAIDEGVRTTWGHPLRVIYGF